MTGRESGGLSCPGESVETGMGLREKLSADLKDAMKAKEARNSQPFA